MVSKTLLTLIEGYTSLHSRVGGHQHFNTEKIKTLVSNPKGAITIGASIRFAVQIGLVNRVKAGVYYFTKSPQQKDIEQIYSCVKKQQFEKQQLAKIERKVKRQTKLFNNEVIEKEESLIFLKDATINDLVSRIKELGYTGELTPTKNTISF
jgi:hypothetical protein